MGFLYVILGTLASPIADPLAIALTIGMAFVRDARRAILVALIGTAAVVVLWAFVWGGRYYGTTLPIIAIKVVGTLVWAAAGWGVGALVRRLRRHMAAVDTVAAHVTALQTAALEPAGAPATMAPPSFAAVSQQIVLVRRAIGLGEQLRAAVVQRVGAADPTVAAIDRDLEQIRQARAQLQQTKQPLGVEAAQRLDRIAAQFDAAWRVANPQV